MTETNAGYGQQSPYDTSNDFNKLRFLVKQMLGTLSTNKLVEVVAVYKADGAAVPSADTGVVGPAGYVDVKILVNQIDGAGQNVEHETIYGVPFGRGQGGGNGIVCDPQVGDVGLMACADRDISSVKANRGGARPPGSFRRMDAADGMYVCTLLGKTPQQYVRFGDDSITQVDVSGNTITTTPSGVKVTDTNGNVIETSSAGITMEDVGGSKIEMAGGNVTVTTGAFIVNGALSVSGNAVIDGEVTGGPSGVGLTTHVHTQGNDSHGDTEVPTNPPTPGS